MEPGMLRGLDKVMYGLGLFIIGIVFMAGYLLGHC